MANTQHLAAIIIVVIPYYLISSKFLIDSFVLGLVSLLKLKIIVILVTTSKRVVEGII